MNGKNATLIAAACVVSAFVGIFVSGLSADRHVAHSQAAPANERFIMATSGYNPKGTTDVYIFDTSQMKIACYTRDPHGIVLKGTRQINYDLCPEEVTLQTPTQKISVREMRQKIEGK